MNSIYQPYWTDYLKQFDLPISHFQYITPIYNTSKSCVIIETRSDPLLILVIKNFMYLLQKKNYSFIIFHGTDNESFLKSNLKIPNLHFVNLLISSLNVDNYSQLLCTPFFWNYLNKLNISHILLYQMDTILLKDNIDDFLPFHYVGAPWPGLIVNNIIKNNLKTTNNKVVLSVGNGGLSLRDVKVMLEIVNKHSTGKIVHKYPNEDVFFSYWCFIDNYNIPSLEKAKQFAVESMYYEDPIGLHKPHLSCYPSIEHYKKMLSKRYVIETIPE